MVQPMDDLLTTRQLKDLLQVDRITIYRMLQDGRLRGFKVGGQWRFSRREIDAWLQEQQIEMGWTPTPTLPTEHPVPLSQVLPLSCIQAIQAVCAEAMGIALVTIGMDGVPLSGVSNSCDFCDLILATERGRLRCAESWQRRPNGQLHPCHAEVPCASLPISVEGQPVAIVAACQFVALDPGRAEPGWPSHLPDLAAALSLAEADLQAAEGTVRVVTEDYLLRVPGLLRRISETFSEIGQERMELLGRLVKIAEMSTI